MVGVPISVLLVEDNDDDAALVLEALKDGGYLPRAQRVYSREGLRSALRDGEWDVVISDHNLPSFSAVEALLLLLESRRDIPFIIVSGTIGEELAVEAMKAGAQDFIMKDSLGRLVPSVSNAMEAAAARRANNRAQTEVRESRERLRELTLHLESVREDERARLAREIHDELGGILTALKMDVAWLSRRVGDEPLVAEKLHSMTELTDGAIKTMRRIITDLRPSILDDLGLVAAIEWQLRDFQKRSGIRGVLELGFDPDVSTLSFDEKLTVAAFRIFQESLTNVARHAQATRVDVRAQVEGGVFMLDVRDNGIGFEPNPLRRGSFGILGMRERAEHLGGTLDVRGRPGEGTTVCLSVPYIPQRAMKA